MVITYKVILSSDCLLDTQDSFSKSSGPQTGQPYTSSNGEKPVDLLVCKQEVWQSFPSSVTDLVFKVLFEDDRGG